MTDQQREFRGNQTISLPALAQRFQLPLLDLHIIRDTVAKGASFSELGLFLYQCNRTKLDPLLKQAYWINHNFIVGIDGYRLIAQRTGEYHPGTTSWLTAEGKWVSEWTTKEPPVSARVSVFRNAECHEVTVRFDAYRKNTPVWMQMPEHMLAKCAESLAIRKAFPAETSGTLTQEEMGMKVIDHIDEETGEVKDDLDEILDANNLTDPKWVTALIENLRAKAKEGAFELFEYGKSLNGILDDKPEADRKMVRAEYKRLRDELQVETGNDGEAKG